MSREEFCDAWQSFGEGAELLVAYNHGTIRLLKNVFESADASGSKLKQLPAPRLKTVTLKSINYDQVDAVRGLDITITTTARTAEEGRVLLEAFNFPFRK